MRYIINLFASPLKLRELILGFILIGVTEALLAFVYVVPIAFRVHSLEIWDMGLYMFEDMRTAITLGAIPYNSLLRATVLNLVCLVLGFLFLHWMLALARRKGYVSRLVQD